MKVTWEVKMEDESVSWSPPLHCGMIQPLSDTTCCLNQRADTGDFFHKPARSCTTLLASCGKGSANELHMSNYPALITRYYLDECFR